MRPEDIGTYYESILEKEVRKEGGIYYTPPLIVDYMVANSLGELLKGKAPAKAAKIRIVDPACGGGIFLLGAYQHLLDWHEKHLGKLTLTQRRKILNDHIFGVDIDPLAVEITKYCLSMKCLGGKDFSLDFAENIRCGNSLISHSKVSGDRAFDWHKTFPHVFKQGGFDIVIGNPPWGAKYSDKQKTYFKEHYKSAKTVKYVDGTYYSSLDTFSLFIEQGFNMVKQNGRIMFIVPLSVIAGKNSSLHRLLLKNCETIDVSSYSDRPKQIFQSGHRPVSIIGFTKTDTPCTKIFTTKLNRWYSDLTLQQLVGNLTFIESKKHYRPGRFARIGQEIESIILDKIYNRKNTPIKTLQKKKGKPLFWRNADGGYYSLVLPHTTRSKYEDSFLFDVKIVKVICAILSSNLFFWHQKVYSDNYHLTKNEIESFPLPPLGKFTDEVIAEIESRYDDYVADVERHVIVRSTRAYSQADSIREYKLMKSRDYANKIDEIISPLYGLTDEETEFIKNYELEFRMRGE